MNGHSDETYDKLAKRADETRSRLMATLDTLERRRHELTDVPLQITRHPVLSLGVGLGVLAGLGGIVAAIAIRFSHPVRRRWFERGRAVRRLWAHPDRVGRAGEGPLLPTLGKKILLGTASWLAISLAKRALLPVVRNA